MSDSEYVFLSNNGFVLSKNKEIIPKNSILDYITALIELDKKYTLRSYFKFLEIYQKEELEKTRIYPFWTEYCKCPKKKCVEKDIKYIRLAKYVKVDSVDEKSSYYSYLCGINKKKDEYTLEYFSLDKMLDIPIKIGNIRIEENNIDAESSELSTFTLFEFFNSITNQITTYESPKERKEAFEEIKKFAH